MHVYLPYLHYWGDVTAVDEQGAVDSFKLDDLDVVMGGGNAGQDMAAILTLCDRAQSRVKFLWPQSVQFSFLAQSVIGRILHPDKAPGPGRRGCSQ